MLDDVTEMPVATVDDQFAEITEAAARAVHAIHCPGCAVGRGGCGGLDDADEGVAMAVLNAAGVRELLVDLRETRAAVQRVRDLAEQFERDGLRPTVAAVVADKVRAALDGTEG